MKIKHIDFQAVLESVCFFLLAGAIFYLIKTRNYLIYVTPKMLPYLCFSSALLMVWGFTNLLGNFKGRFKRQYSHCLILIVPVLIITLACAAPLQETALGGYMNVQKKETKRLQNQVSKTETLDNDFSEPFPPTENYYNTKDRNSQNSIISPEEQAELDNNGVESNVYTNEYGTLHGLDYVNKTITISDTEVYGWIVEIYENSDKYVGFTVIQKGTVYHNESFKNNQFSAVRPLMSCCVADVVSVGFICNYGGANQLEENDWVTIKGEIILCGSEVQIEVMSVEPAEPAKEYYVYPF